MSRRHLVLFVLSVLAATLCSADDSSDREKVWSAREAENAHLLDSIDSLEPMRFYRLDGGMKKDPMGPKGSFHGYAVIADGTPEDIEVRKAFMASLRRVLESSHGGQSACFEPRHGLRLTDGKTQYDIVLCFECNAFVVYEAEGDSIYMSGFDAKDELERWNEAFAAATR